MLAPPPQPSKQKDGVPRAMDNVIATGMAKDPAERYAAALELARAAHDATTTPLPSLGPAAPVYLPAQRNDRTTDPIDGEDTQLAATRPAPALPPWDHHTAKPSSTKRAGGVRAWSFPPC